MKGCWISSNNVDLSTLILELFTRRQKQRNIRAQQVREKEQAEKERQEREKAKRKAEAAKAAKLAMEQAKAKAIQQAIVDQQNKSRLTALQAIATQQNNSRRAAQSFINQRSTAGLPTTQVSHGRAPQSAGGQPQLEITRWNKELRDVLTQHKTDMRMLMQVCLHSGIFAIPEAQSMEIRHKSLAKLRRCAEGLRRCNVIAMNDQQLIGLMGTSEKEIHETMNKAISGNPATTTPNRASNAPSITSLSSSMQKVSPTPGSILNRTAPSSAAKSSVQPASSREVPGAPYRQQNLSGVSAGILGNFSSTQSPQVNTVGNGKWRHRLPKSETAPIPDMCFRSC
jgi:hypothetical protein